MEQTPPSMSRYLTSSNTGSYRVQDSEEREGLAEKDGGSSQADIWAISPSDKNSQGLGQMGIVCGQAGHHERGP